MRFSVFFFNRSANLQGSISLWFRGSDAASFNLHFHTFFFFFFFTSGLIPSTSTTTNQTAPPDTINLAVLPNFISKTQNSLSPLTSPFSILSILPILNDKINTCRLTIVAD